MTQRNQPQFVREVFGQLPDGTASEMVKLRGDNGFEARIMTYGAALQSLLFRIAPGDLRMWFWAATI
jgi:aldose 1-epimerase